MPETWARRLCWLLAAIDLELGIVATLFPAAYLAFVHPGLPAAEHPYDWVVRTGVLWLVYLVLEVTAALSAAPARWFFCVAILRLMEVPADLAYAALARGASPLSTAVILAAPLLNALAGAGLLLASRPAQRPPVPPET